MIFGIDAITSEDAFWDSGLQLCLVPAGAFTREFIDPYGDRFSLSFSLSLMLSFFLDLWIAANSSSLDIVLLVGDRTRLVGVVLPEEMGVLLPEELLGTGDEQLLPAAVFRVRRSATVGTDRPWWLVGVDDWKPLP